MIAYVLNMDSNGLGVARSLGRSGVSVVGVDFRKDTPGLKSRYCDPLLCADPVREPEEVLDLLLREGRKLEEPGILYPTSDAFVVFVSRHRKELGECFRFNIPSETIIEGLSDKRIQYDEAQRLGIPTAKTFYPKSLDEVKEIENSLEYPAFLKPCCSHLWQERFKNKGFVVKDPVQLENRFRDTSNAKLAVMVQSIILGPNTNHVKVCAYFSRNRQLLGVFTTQKIRQYPTDFGVGTLMKSVHNDEVRELGLCFFRGVGYQGIGSIEFKKDERDGKYKMIELNARVWQQNIQATLAGINFPLMQYLELTDRPVTEQHIFREGVRWFDAIQDFQAFWLYRKRGMLSTTEWLRSWWGSESYAYFAWDDVKPAWKNSRFGLKYLKLPFYVLNKRLT